MAIKNYESFNFKNGLKGFEGNELEYELSKNIKIIAYQTILNERNSQKNPSIGIILQDSRENHKLNYQYFFDGNGDFIAGVNQGYNGNNNEWFKHNRVNNLDYLSQHGNSIQNILKDQEIPNELKNSKIIEALKDNSIKEVYKKE
jgi:hypothetical protein